MTVILLPLHKELSCKLARYAPRMGIEPGTPLNLKWAAAPQGMTTFDCFDETLLGDITTWIQAGCFARERIASARPLAGKSGWNSAALSSAVTNKPLRAANRTRSGANATDVFFYGA